MSRRHFCSRPAESQNTCDSGACSASVPSTCDMVSLHRLCASIDLRLSFLPTKPMNHPKTGTKTRVKSVSCHEMKSRAVK